MEGRRFRHTAHFKRWRDRPRPGVVRLRAARGGRVLRPRRGAERRALGFRRGRHLFVRRRPAGRGEPHPGRRGPGPLAPRGHRGPRHLPRAAPARRRPRPRAGRPGRVRRAGARPGARTPVAARPTSTPRSSWRRPAPTPSASSPTRSRCCRPPARRAIGELVTGDPVDALAAKINEVDGREAIIFTEEHFVAELLRRDWTSKARRHLDVPVLHLHGAGELRRAGRRRRGRVAHLMRLRGRRDGAAAATYAAVLDGVHLWLDLDGPVSVRDADSTR